MIGRAIYYITQPTSNTTLQFCDFGSRRSITIARDLGGAAELGGFATSPDGRIILYARRDSSATI